MKLINYFSKFTFITAILFSCAIFSPAQTQNLPAPREEKLLNGLKLLVWNEPKAEKITIKMRIHSGSAFDPLGKEGVMRLLSDILFPNESIKEFFSDDLGGNLEIISNYDYIQINASGDADKFLTILETLSGALTNPQINKETTEKVRSTLLARVKELEKNPAYVADQAVAKRLLGNFPYGRPQLGSSESLQKIDFADILFAKERFLTADNATIAISGNVKPDFALRATKRLFGGWLKADKKVPATFAQPDAPDVKALIVNSPITDNSEIRYAMRGLARNDKDFVSANVLARIMQNRLLKEMPKDGKISAFVTQNSNLLPGLIIVGLSNFPFDKESQMGSNPPRTHMIIFKEENLAANLVFEKISTEEFERAKNEVQTEVNQRNLMDFWLDIETFKLGSIKEELEKTGNVKIEAVQKIAEKLVKEPTVTVLLLKPKTETNQ